MMYSVVFRSTLDGPSLGVALDQIVSHMPFVVSECNPVGAGTWEIVFVPKQPHLSLSFAKFVELQLHLSRCGDILELQRSDDKIAS